MPALPKRWSSLSPLAMQFCSILSTTVSMRLTKTRVDRTDLIDRLTITGPALQAFDVGARRLLVHLDREDQRNVDVVAAIDRLFDRRQALFGAGNFDHHVGAVNASPQLLDHRNGAGRIVSQQRRDLQADESVVSARRVVDRTKGVARALDILDGKIPEERVGAFLRSDQLAQAARRNRCPRRSLFRRSSGCWSCPAVPDRSGVAARRRQTCFVAGYRAKRSARRRAVAGSCSSFSSPSGRRVQTGRARFARHFPG